MRIFFTRQFATFLMTGGTAAAINFSSRFLYNLLVTFPVAVALAYLTGMVTAFTLAKLFVFRRASRPTAHSAVLFGVVNLLAFAQTWIISVGLAYQVFPAIGLHQHDKAIANLIGIIFPVFTSFFGHKYISFRETGDAPSSSDA